MSTEFTPFASLLGGAMIGVAAVAFMALHGRIAGISGIVARLLPPASETSDNRELGLAFVCGLVLGAPLLAMLKGQAGIVAPLGSLPLLLLAGLLVGYGTGIGSGCTSGHGVCGLSRLSVRSLVATVVFMVCAMVTVFIVRHVLGLGGAA